MDLRVLTVILHEKMISLSCLGSFERSQSEWYSGLSPAAEWISFEWISEGMGILDSEGCR